MTEKDFRTHILLGGSKKLIDKLSNWTLDNTDLDKKVSTNIILVCSQFNELEEKNNNGSLDLKDYNIGKNKIKESLLGLIPELKENGFIKEVEISSFPEIAKTKIENKLNLFNTPSSLFTGRKDKLAKIDKAFHENQIITVTGIGGIGKTQLVLKFIDSFDEAELKKITWQDFSESSHFDNFIVASGFEVIIQSNKKRTRKI